MTRKGESRAKTLADWAYVAIDKHFHKVLNHEAGVLQDEDPEELHQMRVGLRRLRSALTGFAPALELSKFARQKAVGKIARSLGKLRDLDVLKEALISHYKPLLPQKEQNHLQEAVNALESQREKEFEEVCRLLKSPIYDRFRLAFQDWLENPTYQPIGCLPITTILPDLLLPQVSYFLLHEGWLIGIDRNVLKVTGDCSVKEIDRLLEREGNLLHDLRKEAKRSRYNMELFAHFYDKKYRKHLEEIKKSQEVLGELQDYQVLSEFLTGVFGDSLGTKMPTLLNIFQRISQQKWQEWQSLQKKFLSVNIRYGLHEAILHPIGAENGVEFKD